MYYLCNNNSQQDILTIPNNFVKNINFEISTYTCFNTELYELNSGLKINKSVIGPVFIHGAAFSPPGCLHIKVNENNEYNGMICDINCNVSNICYNIKCLFILFNDLKNINTDININELIKKIET